MTKVYVLVEFNYDVGDVAEQVRDALRKKYNAPNSIHTADITDLVQSDVDEAEVHPGDWTPFLDACSRLA